MIKVPTKPKLKDAPTDQLVYVETNKRLYHYIGGGWVEKKYFTTTEVSEILQTSEDTVRRTLKRYSMVSRYEQTRIDHKAIMMLSKILNMRKQKISHRQIKKTLAYGD